MTQDRELQTEDEASKQHGDGKRRVKMSSSAQRAASFISRDQYGETIKRYRKCPWLLFGDWLWRFPLYWADPSHFVSWWTAAGFLFGATCFAIASFASVSPSIYTRQVVGNCMGDVDDWLVTFVYLLGDTVWNVSTILQLTEALNSGYDKNVHEWELAGSHGPKPKYKWFGVAWTSRDWWGAVAYSVGELLYWITALVGILEDCPATGLSTDVYLWLNNYFYLIGGILFLVGGALYAMEEVSIWLIPAIFFPTSKMKAISLLWWSIWCYFWAGVLYAMAGIQLYWNSPVNAVETQEHYNIITAIGFGGGSILFMLGALLLLARQSRGRCRPIFAVVDPSGHLGGSRGVKDSANGIDDPQQQQETNGNFDGKHARAAEDRV